jgi:hypothetical protein
MSNNDPQHDGIEIVSMSEFVRRTPGGRYPRGNVSTFKDLSYDCTCGHTHRFDVGTTLVLIELAGNRMVLSCPHGAALTCVEVRGLGRRLVTVFGARKRAGKIRE